MEEQQQAAQEVNERNGVNKSIYLTKAADGFLRRLAKVLGRSESAVVSRLVEKYGPELAKEQKPWG